MKRILIVIAYFFGTCAMGCLLAFPVYLILESDFEKIVSRSILVCAVILFFPTCKLLDANHATYFGIKKSGRGVTLLTAWGLGIAMLLPISIYFLLCEFRTWESFSANEILSVPVGLLSAIISGAIIAIIEEPIFRGILQSELNKIYNSVITVFIVCFIYSSVHFLNTPEEITLSTVRWYSGLSVFVSAFAPLADIATIWDSWLALFTAGVFLCLIRIRTDNLLWCIGLHAGWVAHIKIFKELTDRNNQAPCSNLAGQYDNYIGEFSTVWIILLLAMLSVYWSNTKN